MRDTICTCAGSSAWSNLPTKRQNDLDYAVRIALSWLEDAFSLIHLQATSTITTVSGTAEYDLATDFNGFVKSMDISGYSSEITFLSQAEMESKFTDNTDTGQPYYAAEAPPNATADAVAPGTKRVRLAPVPSGEYTINYTYQKKHPAYSDLDSTDYLRLEDSEADALCWKSLMYWRSDATGVEFQKFNENLNRVTARMIQRLSRPRRSQIGDIFSAGF